MSDINECLMSGRLGKDAEFQTFDSGKQKYKNTLAVSRYDGKDEEGKAKYTTDWIDIEAWGQTADLLGTHFSKKGQYICAKGDVRLNTWTDKDGNKRSKHSLNVRSVIFLPTDKGGKNTQLTEEEKEAMFNSGEIPF